MRCRTQIFHEDNRVAHTVDYEGQPGRRPLTYDELQALFDAVDGRVELARARGRKGALTAMRDAALIKTIYAFGLRRNEARMLDLADLRRSPKSPQYGTCGALFVRYGKASSGGPPKRRTVLTVPEMDWITDVMQHWILEVRPLLCPGKLAALFVTERAGRMSLRGLNVAFTQARDDAGLPAELDLHALRHSYVHAPGGVRLSRAVRVAASGAISTRARQPSIRECRTNTERGCCGGHCSTSTATYGRTSDQENGCAVDPA